MVYLYVFFLIIFTHPFNFKYLYQTSENKLINKWDKFHFLSILSMSSGVNLIQSETCGTSKTGLISAVFVHPGFCSIKISCFLFITVIFPEVIWRELEDFGG